MAADIPMAGKTRWWSHRTNPLNQPAMAPNIPMAAGIHPSLYNMNLPTHHDPHYSNPHNLNPLHKITPPKEDPDMNGAKCGRAHYTLPDIIYARAQGCANLPFYHGLITTRRAVEYYPKTGHKYTGTAPFYLFPVGRPVFYKNTLHYGMDRVVLNHWCQVVGLLTERPRLRHAIKLAGKKITGRPLEKHEQKKY
ncbi:hypothetical protein EPUL_002240, partial [Erysiphe pulchra]